MPEAAIGSPERVAQHVVTSDNLAAFTAKKLDLFTPEPPKAETPAHVVASEPPKEAPKAEAPPPAAEETTKLEEELKEEEAKPHPDEKKKQTIRERISEINEKKKASDARATAAEERAAKAEREAAELRARLTPTPIEAGAEPQRAAFATEQEYLDAKIAHGVKAALAKQQKDEAEARERTDAERAMEAHRARTIAVKQEIPDYDARIAKAADLVIPGRIGKLMIESDLSPRIALYFADHPAEVGRLNAMQDLRLGKEFAGIEAMIEAQAAPKAEAKEPPKTVAAISAAPPPIAPLKGATGAIEAKVDSDGRFTGTFAEFKALRKQGKLK